MNPKHLRGLAVAALMAFGLTMIATSSVRAQDRDDFPSNTPIKHVIVIFQENVSFDHYFGTYPHAQPNTDGTVYFHLGKDSDTPRANTLDSAGLLTDNPNGANPVRIDRSFAVTCDNDHAYTQEQAAFHGGLMDMFVAQTGCTDVHLGKTAVLDYFDGNTVTAEWNYAQHFAMSDNFFGTTFGPSTPGAMNVIAGNTYAGTITNGLSGSGFIAGGASSGAVVGDADPSGDTCSNPKRTQVTMSGKNIGDLLNAAGITWGSFMGGFNTGITNSNGTTGCTRSSAGLAGTTGDYIPHHAWFQYWASTLNAGHVRPSSPSMIGKSDAAHHEYDVNDFFTALANGNLPAVSYLKAPAFEDGHAGYSDPLDEQIFLVNTINAIEASDEWKETAIFITYDDSDGWYDHVMGPIVRQSDVSDPKAGNSDSDALLGPGNCGTPTAVDPAGDIQNGRCGYGPRLPLVVISPCARQNYIDHRVTDFSSIVRFIEDNFNLGRIGNGSNDAIAGTLNGIFDFDSCQAHKLILDPGTGQIVDTGDKDKD
ncbi:MAG: phospholipase C [Candidatus Acidiferrales bacterium]